MSILSAIADALVEIVPDASIYTENQPQGFVKPSFYVHAINSTVKEEVMGYQMLKHSYAIVWFPDGRPNTQIEAMKAKLMDGFRMLKSVNLTPFNKEFIIADETLVFTFNLRHRSVFVDSNSAKVERLEQKGGIKK